MVPIDMFVGEKKIGTVPLHLVVDKAGKVYFQSVLNDAKGIEGVEFDYEFDECDANIQPSALGKVRPELVEGVELPNHKNPISLERALRQKKYGALIAPFIDTTSYKNK